MQVLSGACIEDATAACEPSEIWHTCFACKGSALEPFCNKTVNHYRKHGLCYYQKKKKGTVAASLC